MTAQDDTKAYRRDIAQFEKLSAKYERMRIQAIRVQIYANLLKELENAGVNPKRILDVGCGTGVLLRTLADRYPDAELHGLDISPGMLREARAKLSEDFQADFRQGAAEDLPYEDGHFDLVLSTICFHHWHSRVDGLREVHRVLAPGGLFGLADHFAIGWLRPMFTLFRMRDRVHTPAEVESLMADAGLGAREWHLVYSLRRRYPFIHAVLADRP
jgi:ubiquinone/menaquinone biosynthesis C-methylase UbiE